MTKEDPTTYGAAMGGHYDRLVSDSQLQTTATVRRLADIALSVGGMSILEFGIGTGRIALPLVQAGFRVAGIDASTEMLKQLQAKPGAEEIETVVGDYCDQQVNGEFSVVLLNFNGIFAPQSREAQIACFHNAARHLPSEGCFVVDAYVLTSTQLGGDWSIRPRTVEHEHVELELSRYDISTGRVERSLVHLLSDGSHFVSIFDTYASPGELDLIAQSTGFSLRERHSDWSEAPFTSHSQRHVSIYERL